MGASTSKRILRQWWTLWPLDALLRQKQKQTARSRRREGTLHCQAQSRKSEEVPNVYQVLTSVGFKITQWGNRHRKNDKKECFLNKVYRIWRVVYIIKHDSTFGVLIFSEEYVPFFHHWHFHHGATCIFYHWKFKFKILNIGPNMRTKSTYNYFIVTVYKLSPSS